jgi:hypothetical protein
LWFWIFLLGKAGLPPIIYDIIQNSPAAKVEGKVYIPRVVAMEFFDPSKDVTRGFP